MTIDVENDDWIQEELDEGFLGAVGELGHLNGEWITFVAFRDGLSVALQSTNVVTRNETLRLAERLLPNVFSRNTSQLHQHWASKDERILREIARMNNRPFIEVLTEEIKRQEDELKLKDPQYQARSIRTRLDGLKKILNNSTSNKFFEGKLILIDAATGNQLPSSQEGNFYEFALSSGRGLRIRIAHDTPIEAINGADIIYEHHIPNERRARIMAVQYKIIDDNDNVPKSKELKSQLNRLNHWYCKTLPCISDSLPCNNFFRLPPCAAFLRATNKLQDKDSAGISLGYYIPVCRVMKNYNDRRISINTKNYQGEAITHKLFEDLFNLDILGSRWMTYELDSCRNR